MEDNSFLIDDNVIVNGRVDTGETVYLIKDSDDGMYFWADNEDLTLDKEEHE